MYACEMHLQMLTALTSVSCPHIIPPFFIRSNATAKKTKNSFTWWCSVWLCVVIFQHGEKETGCFLFFYWTEKKKSRNKRVNGIVHVRGRSVLSIILNCRVELRCWYALLSLCQPLSSCRLSSKSITGSMWRDWTCVTCSQCVWWRHTAVSLQINNMVDLVNMTENKKGTNN